MARRSPTRQQITRQAIQARSPGRSGGTSAPRKAAGGPRTGLGRRQPVRPVPRAGLGGNRPAASSAEAGAGAGAAGGGASPYATTPWDSAYESAVSGAHAGYQHRTAGFDEAERGIEQDYGLAPGFNDYKANPYSRAALLQSTYLQANRGAMNSAGLQLYSGSTGNRLAHNRSERGERRNQLESEYRRDLEELRQDRLEAKERQREEEDDATWRRNETAEGADLEPEPGGRPQRQRSRRQPRSRPKSPAVGRGRPAPRRNPRPKRGR
jgi:hypothetical protein